MGDAGDVVVDASSPEKIPPPNNSRHPLISSPLSDEQRVLCTNKGFEIFDIFSNFSLKPVKFFKGRGRIRPNIGPLSFSYQILLNHISVEGACRNSCFNTSFMQL